MISVAFALQCCVAVLRYCVTFVLHHCVENILCSSPLLALLCDKLVICSAVSHCCALSLCCVHVVDHTACWSRLVAPGPNGDGGGERKGCSLPGSRRHFLHRHRPATEWRGRAQLWRQDSEPILSLKPLKPQPEPEPPTVLESEPKQNQILNQKFSDSSVDHQALKKSKLPPISSATRLHFLFDCQRLLAGLIHSSHTPTNQRTATKKNLCGL